MPDFGLLETFLWVAKLGSFRMAAERLNTTQPAVSQRIARLECQMGVRLLNRGSRGVSVTPSGQQAMVYVEKMIGLRAAMMAEIGDASGMHGVMRLGVAETIVHTWLPQFVKSVNRLYPNLLLEIEVDITPNLAARLLAQEIELAFVVGPLSNSGIHNRVLAEYPIGFLASPLLGLGNGLVTREDLARFPIITFPRKTRPYEAVRELFARPGSPPIRLHASTSLASVIHMALEGLNVAVIPTASVERELADGRLQLLDTGLSLTPLTFTASWLTSPDMAALEQVADLARQTALSNLVVETAAVVPDVEGLPVS
ncbi:LysR family transcriptional regulator [Bradyrhizobium murdochi]|uniref:LysR family transcriptional regulator n=1 Tax=Bradyrhizobium murdochi TaxID=1038859 RepID=UPI0004190BA9|nr:LysR family transcriptional regulator [Bradyrhizobium murdochi]